MMKKFRIIYFLCLLSKVSFLISSSNGYLNSIQNNTQDELHINKISLSKNATIVSTQASNPILQRGYTSFANKSFESVIYDLNITGLFGLAQPGTWVAISSGLIEPYSMNYSILGTNYSHHFGDGDYIIFALNSSSVGQGNSNIIRVPARTQLQGIEFSGLGAGPYWWHGFVELNILLASLSGDAYLALKYNTTTKNVDLFTGRGSAPTGSSLFSSGLVAKNILEIVDKDAESISQKNSNSSTPNIATYIQFLDGAQLTALCSALSAVQSGYSYNQNSSIPTKFDDQYIVITNFNPILDLSSSPPSLSNLGYYDQYIIDSYRIQIINVSHFGNLPYYNLAIQINKENLGYGLLTPDNTQGQVSASRISPGVTSTQFLYPSFISCGLSSNETFSKNFSRFIIDLQGYLASGQVLLLNNGISIMGCDTIDVGGGFNQDIPMLNLISNSRDNKDQPIILPNSNGSAFINLSVVFGDLQLTSNNLMLFSVPTQALTDGVNIEMTQPIAGNYQLVFTSTKDFTDSDGNSIPKGSVFAAQKVFIDPALLKKSSITVNFLGLANDSNWNSPRIMQSVNVGQTLNFNLQYSVSQNQNILTIMPLSKELFTTKNSVVLQQNDFLTELRYLVFFDKSYDSSKRAEVLLDDSFVDAINSQLYQGKSVVLGSQITKSGDTFTGTFIAYDSDSKISFATNTKSITKEKSSSITDKSSVFSIGMIYNSVALGRLEIPLWYTDGQNYNAPLLFSLNQKEQATFKNILNLNTCDYLTLFSYSLILNQSAGNDSLSVQLDSSFIDTINMHLYNGKSVILNMKSQKNDNAFDFNFTAYDSNTHELLAKGSKSIQNANTSVTAIDMIYASNKISEQVLGLNIFKTTQFALPLNISDEAQVSLLINAKSTGKKSTCKKPKKLDNQVGSKAKKETKLPKKTKEKSIKNKDKKALITSSKTDKKDQSMIDQLEKQNKQLQQEVQELLAQKKSK